MEEEDDNVALSRSMLVPYRNPNRFHDGDVPSVRRRQLAVVPTASAITTAASFSRFKIPRGWYVESVPRADGIRSDRYYYEPATGRKFRSTKEVERFLAGVEYTPRSRSRSPFTLGNMKSSGSRKMIVSGGMLLPLDKRESSRGQLVVASTVAASMKPFNLPDGWVVEEVPRRKCHGWVDKFYYEPGTGRRFRSLLSVQRYLAEEGADEPLSLLFKSTIRLKKFGLQNKISSGKLKSSTSDRPKPPEKINWVLADPRGNMWNPFIGESMIPEPIKQRWANRFAVSVDDTNSAAPFVE